MTNDHNSRTQPKWKDYLRSAEEILTGPANHPENIQINQYPVGKRNKFTMKIYAQGDRLGKGGRE